MQVHGEGLNTADSFALKHLKMVHVLVPELMYVSQPNKCVCYVQFTHKQMHFFILKTLKFTLKYT